MLIAVDTGGTKTLVTQFGTDGKIGEVIRFPTPSDQNEYISLLCDTIKKNYSGQVIDAIVVALPGIIKNGVAVWCNNLGWKNFDAHRALTNALHGSIETTIFVENDANLAGLAETRALNPLPVSSLYVTISTGIGTGVITNGLIDPGLRYSEGGRSLVEFEGKVREWESFASGKSIHETYGKYARDITDPEIWREIADKISRGFLAIIPFIQPDTIIIGGSIGAYFDRFSKPLEAILQEKLPPHIPCPLLLAANHPEEAVVYGCYYYALDQLARS